MEDHQIIELYFARDERAIDETARQYGPLCMQVSMGILHSRPDAEECVNDTYLKVWNVIPPRRPSHFKAFLCKITRRLSLNRYRDQHRACRNKDLEVAMEELGDCIPAPEEPSQALTRYIADFLREQNPVDRRIFMQRYWHAVSVKDLSKNEGMTPNAVSLRLYKNREKLRAYLEERGDHV